MNLVHTTHRKAIFTVDLGYLNPRPPTDGGMIGTVIRNLKTLKL